MKTVHLTQSAAKTNSGTAGIKQNKKIYPYLRNSFMILLMMIVLIPVWAQNQVTIQVMVPPPYSPKLSSYLDNPNRVLLTLINTTGAPREIYLHGKFANDDESIAVQTADGYKPSQSLHLEPYESLQASVYELEGIFNGADLTYTGITEAELINNQGVPEGSYRFCFQAFDYATSQPVSQNTCSNLFQIVYVDPPVIISPVCGDSIAATDPQNVIISWTFPVGAVPGNVQYRLQMVEMFPDDRDPNEALQATGRPYFMDVTTNINSLVISSSEPELITGRSYAFLVQAEDISGDVVFRNFGKSEACWFKYKEPGMLPVDLEDSIPDFDIGFDDFIHDMELLPQTSISGQLLYKLASDANINQAGSGAVSNGIPYNSGGTTYDEMNNSEEEEGNANYNGFSFNGVSGFTFEEQNYISDMSFTPPFGMGYINADVVDRGAAEPLTNTMIRLVARFCVKNDDGFYEPRLLTAHGEGRMLSADNYIFYDIHGHRVDPEKVLSTVDQVLAVDVTDNAGNYSFDFTADFFTGPIYAFTTGSGTGNFGDQGYAGVISLRIELLNKKFCSPDVDIFAMPGDELQIPAQVSLIKDFSMHLFVYSEWDESGSDGEDTTYLQVGHDVNPKTIAGGEGIPNAIVKVLRSTQELANEHPAVLLAEGQHLGSTTVNDNGEFKDVFIGRTNENGAIDISKLVSDWIISRRDPFPRNITPYYLSVRVRDEHADSTNENTRYNYTSYFGQLIFTQPTSENNAEQDYWDQDVVYNHNYSPPNSASHEGVGLKALPPEIKGRLMAKSNLENVGLPDEEVDLEAGYTPEFMGLHEATVKTNNAGFYRFKDLYVLLDDKGNANGPWRRIHANPKLYKHQEWPPEGQQPLNLIYGQLYQHNFNLEPAHLLRGEVVDETGKPVAAYIKVLENNPYVKTKKTYEYDNNGVLYVEREWFETPAALKGNRIEVLPLSNTYFPDTLLVDMPENEQQFVKLQVYRKMHRLSLTVINEETNAALPGADVVVGDTLIYGKTDQKGQIELVFPSPGEQFMVKVSVDGYTPKRVSFNIPVTNSWEYRMVRLQPAMKISGVITEKQSHQPIDSALIYIRIQNTDGHHIYLESYSGVDGHYTLKGIPMTLTTVDVHVVKEGNNPSYIGTTKTINVEPFAYPVPSYDFQLAAVDWDLSNIWGFPVVVEKFMSKNTTNATISGYFYNMPHIAGFELTNRDEKLYFKDLQVKKAAGNEMSPLGDKVITETFTVPVKLNGGFEGRYHIPSDWMNRKPLVLRKNGDYGVMTAALKVDLASFKFAYDFHGDFYIGDDTTRYAFTVFRSTSSAYGGMSWMKHFIFDLNNLYKPVPVSDFQVFGFNASSDFAGAYYMDDAMHIGTILHTDIAMPNGQPLDLKIHAGEVVVTKEDIDVKPNPDNLISFDLEKWKVESKSGWYFDKTKDAIVIPKALILTGLGVDATIKGLNIRPNALREGQIVLEGGLSLGGIAILKTAPGTEPIFNYDAGVGHYRISLVGNAQGSVAWLDNLPATNDRLEFTAIGMLSDNSSVLDLGKTMRFHNILDVFVDEIITGNGFFKLAGMPDLGIPGFVPATAEITYTKPNSKLEAKLEPLVGFVDCNANVSFKLKREEGAQLLSKNKYTSKGDFFIKPPPGESGSEIKVHGFLTKTPGSCVIDVVPQTIHMGKEEMNVTEGSIAVTNNQWGNLAFEAKTNSTGLDDNNTVSFLVHGGLEVNSDGVKVDHIETPLGDLSMAYLFPESALVGDLTIKGPLEMGFATINSGAMTMRFDKSGFYMMFNGNITMTEQEYFGGFILGDYSKDLNAKAAVMLKEFEKNPPDFSTLHGFYAVGQRNLINKSFWIACTPPLKVSVKAGIGAYVHLDYANPTFMVGGYAFAKARGGTNVPLCGFVGARAIAFFNVEGGYEAGELEVESCGYLNVEVGACGLEGSLTIFNRNRLSTHGCNVELNLSGTCN
jgi:TANFOR domain-containing protein